MDYPQWTSMDYLNGVPMDYLKWATLKFGANINLKMLELKQKMRSIDKHNYGTTRNTINKNSRDLILKLFLNFKSGHVRKYWTRASFPFATYMIRQGIHIAPYILHFNRWPKECSWQAE